MGEATREARQDLADARQRLSTEVDELDLAVRSAVDLPAKIRRSPVRAAALGGGAVFLVAGGPKRVASRIVRLARRPKPSPVRSLLPDEVERIVQRAGTNAADVRVALEAGFADWLEQGRQQKGRGRKKGERRTGGDTFWHLFDSVSAPIASRAAKQFAERLFAAEPDRPRAEGAARPEGAAGEPRASREGAGRR